MSNVTIPSDAGLKQGQNTVFQSWSPDCSTGNWSVPLCDPLNTLCSKRQRSAQLIPFSCANPNAKSSNARHFLLSIVEAKYCQDFATGSTATGIEETANISSFSWTVNVTAVLICHASYSIEQARLDVDVANPLGWGGTNLTGPLTHTGHILPRYNTSQFINDFWNLLDSAASEVPDPSFSSDFDSA